ncbi:hypothetical protein BDA96_04G039500 [Sorghum bicolor]|uniref:Protein kinase domain-containing protein n=1 Tax=Sorghum bicolor TaxID=4558 RepID=A0A921R213_SORBI|nr:hypothetical protein BDA96_04G039500 [Sorghum bicolor]
MDFEATKHSLLERMLLDASAKPTDLPLSLLKSITNGFSDDNRVGSGGFAVVYKAKLQNGEVAVKKLSQALDLDEKNFKKEVSCLMTVRHKNIVRFLGYCADTQGKISNYAGKMVMADERERLLCFEFVPNGNLERYIADASQGPEWSIRYQLIKGICEGLHYLHQNKILHLDLKPANVLIDHNMVPKIADFGLSRRFDENQSHAIASNLVGTTGYLAPEFYGREIRSELDIYSLGVIIIEMLTGRKGYFEIKNVLESWSGRFGTSQGDTRLEQVRVCAEIGLQCIDSDPRKRKTTRCILQKLDEMESRCGFILNGISTSPVTHEPVMISPNVSAPALSHITPISNVASEGVSALQTSSPYLIPQEANFANDTVQEHKPVKNPVQLPVRTGSHGSLNNLPQVHMSNTELNSIDLTNKSSMNMPIGQHPHAQQQPPNYVKIWQGTLSGRRRGERVHICHLEAYRRGTMPEIHVADWPEIMEISRIIDEKHMDIDYCEVADFLTFGVSKQHGFLGQLQEKKLCTVIILPSQTLLLKWSEKVGRLIGMLFPGDIEVLKTPISKSAASNIPAAAAAAVLLHQQQQLLLQQQHMYMQQGLLHQPEMQPMKHQHESRRAAPAIAATADDAREILAEKGRAKVAKQDA